MLEMKSMTEVDMYQKGKRQPIPKREPHSMKYSYFSPHSNFDTFVTISRCNL